MTHTMNITYRCKKQVTRLMATCTQGATKVYPRCTQALGRLMSMLRSSLGAGKEQLRSSLGAAKEHQRSTKGAPKEHQRSTKGAPWSMPTLCLRSAVMVILMMVVGVNGALAQDNYSGTYYIRSTGKNASNTNLYYLCPTENWYFYEATNKYAETDNGYPFLTTYKIKAHDDYDISKAVWSIEKHPSETDCYYIKQLKTGRYLVSNGQITGSSNANRVRVHLEAVADAAALTALGDMALFEITADGDHLDILPHAAAGRNGNNKYLVVNNGNYDQLDAQNSKTDFVNGKYGKGTGGIIGLYEHEDNAKFSLEKTVMPPTITYDEATGTATITSVAGTTIRYAFDGTDPTVGGTSYTSPTDIAVANHTVIKAMAVDGENNASAVVTLNLKEYTYHIVNKDGDVAIQHTIKQVVGKQLSDYNDIPAAIRSPYLEGEDVTFLSNFTDFDHLDDYKITKTPSEGTDIYVVYTTTHLRGKFLHLSGARPLNLKVNGDYVYDSGTAGTGAFAHKNNPTDDEKASNSYFWFFEGEDPYAIEIRNGATNNYIGYTTPSTLSLETSPANRKFVLMTGAAAGDGTNYEQMELMAATGAATGDNTYYRVGYTDDAYNISTTATGDASLQIQAYPNSATITYKLIDQAGKILLNIETKSEAVELPSDWQSPLVEKYNYWKVGAFDTYGTGDNTVYKLKADPESFRINNITEAEGNVIYVTYEVNDKITFDISDDDKTHSGEYPTYMLKFHQGQDFNQENGTDGIETSPQKAEYPYSNGDAMLYIYSETKLNNQFASGASTRPRWLWYAVSPKEAKIGEIPVTPGYKGDPYHVKIMSYKDDVSSKASTSVKHHNFFRTFLVNYGGSDHVVTGLTTKHADVSTLDPEHPENYQLPTEYMVLGAPNGYKLVTLNEIEGAPINGSYGTRQTVNTFEQYWKNNPTVQNRLGGSKVTATETATEDIILTPAQASLLTGWHTYQTWAQAAPWVSWTEDGKTGKKYQNKHHWFQTIDMGSTGEFTFEAQSIDPEVILLDQHGWEIMRAPLSDAAALRKYDSPMVQEYQWYPTAAKVTGYHKYKVSDPRIIVYESYVDAAGKTKWQNSGETYTHTSTSLADNPYDHFTEHGWELQDASVKTDFYVTYTVKPEYARLYTGAATEDAVTPSAFMVKQGNEYAKISEGNTFAPTTDNPYALATIGDEWHWYVKPNFNIDEEMGYEYDVEEDDGAGGTYTPNKAQKNSLNYEEGRNGFDPYNVQIQSVKNDHYYFKTTTTGSQLNKGAWEGTSTDLSLKNMSAGRQTGVTGYDQTTLSVTNATFMVVKDASGHMLLMPRFDHTKVVNSFSETQLSAPNAATQTLELIMAPKVISNSGEFASMNGQYTLAENFEFLDGFESLGSSDNPFTGSIDGVLHTITGLSNLKTPLIAYADGAIIKNIILDNVTIGNAKGENEEDIPNVGAIVANATGETRIYNCGINGGSVGGTGDVGGIVGSLAGSSRVINCYSYATITGGNNVGGIVGNNKETTTAASIKTMVMNCMFYGDITGGTNKSPVYGGTIINNLQGGLNNFNYYAYEKLPTSHITSGKYNNALAVEDKFLNRFEYYRLLLNSNKKLAAFYATSSEETVKPSDIMKWVLETADRTISSEDAKPYPVLKAQGYYPSIINPDFENAPDSATVGRNHGGKLGKTLSVTISGVGSNAPSGASITTGSLTLQRTDKDFDRFNFNYDKVQLPYYNDVGTGNYTKNMVVTGWKITAMSGENLGTDPYSSSNYPTTGIKDYPDHNYADRKSRNKDLYSVSKRVFSQGAYFDVPYGVESITIEPYWGNAIYVADANYDVVYKNDYSGKQNVAQTGTQAVDNTTEFNGQKVRTSITGLGSGTTVYDNAVVLVGNFHLDDVPTGKDGTTPFTMMSVDEDNDHEPDYSLIYHHKNRTPICPIRFDFLNIPGTAQAQKPNGANLICNFTIFKTKGWFEVTNTSSFYTSQVEYENLDGVSKTDAPLILQGGVIDQFVSTQSKTVTGKTIYIHLGGNVWIKEFGMGTHSDGSQSTPHVPVSVTGGEYEGLYLTGTYNANAAVRTDNAECYISGGHFVEAAGASLEQINGNVRWQIYNADIDNFFGGGINEAKPIKGNITTEIYNSHVTLFCGGPKFGNMQTDKTVTTTAEGCTFEKFFGAGYGGTSIAKKKYYDKDGSQNWTTLQNYYATTDRGKYFDGATTGSSQTAGKDYGKKGLGVATDFDYEFFVWSSGTTGARFYVKFASFSLAQCNDVESNLKGCTINQSFYGGGSLGKVVGKATSVLDGCTVHGNVFGGGYSADIPTIQVRDGGFTTNPNYNSSSGMFEPGVFSGTTEFTWKNASEEGKTLTNGQSGSDLTNHYVYTNADLTALGQVGETDLTIKGNTSVTGNVFGGGDESAITASATATGNTKVTIEENDTHETPTVNNVYGGGNTADVDGNTEVHMMNGTVSHDIYGGGRGETTIVGGNVIVNMGAKAGEAPSITYSGTGLVEGDVYGGSALGAVNTTDGKTTTVNVYGGTVNGSVFGGGLGQVAVAADPEHGIEAKTAIVALSQGDVIVNVERGEVKTAVYGGSNVNGVLEKDATVKLIGGTIGSDWGETPPNPLPDVVFGGGKGAPTLVNGNVTVNVGTKSNAEPPATPTYTGTAIIHGNIYGGSALGNTNKTSSSDKEEYHADKNTNVYLYGGEIDGNVFGGGLGQKNGVNGATSDIESFVGGNVNVLLDGAKFVQSFTGEGENRMPLTAQIFGANNLNGTPKGHVKVHVKRTVDSAKDDSKTREQRTTYDVQAVYGGGNMADYVPTDTENGYAEVLIEGCQKTSINYVYGGGNAAAVPATDVTVKGTYIINTLYGGGNGSGDGNPGANIGIYKDGETPTNYGTGKAVTKLLGGYINNVYGGSNTKGDVRGGTDVSTKKQGQVITGDCCSDLYVGEIYGAGSHADVKGDVNITLDCLPDEFVDAVYGGAEEAVIEGNVTLTVTSGKFGRVFGGNNKGGNIKGSITVNIYEDGCKPLIIGEVYGGGNAAPYSIYGCAKDGEGHWTPNTDGTLYFDQETKGRAAIQVNIQACTSVGKVFGGGMGATAKVIGNTNVDVNLIKGIVNGSKQSTIGKVGQVFGGGGFAEVKGNTLVEVGTKLANEGEDEGVNIISGTDYLDPSDGSLDETITAGIYGGGYSADVDGNTTLNIGTKNQQIGEDPSVTIAGNIFGGGLGETTHVTGNVVVNIGTNAGTVETPNYVGYAQITGDVYGGSAKGTVNSADNVNATTDSYTKVNFYGGAITGNIYGGGEGQRAAAAMPAVLYTAEDPEVIDGSKQVGDVKTPAQAAVSEIAANVFGTVTVTTLGGTVNKVFGCNNFFGAPQNTVDVYINGGTVNNSVYGGGNLAAYSAPGGSQDYPAVHINHGTVTENVFGGGYGLSAVVTGNPHITIGDGVKGHVVAIKKSVYGGGELAGVTGDTYIEMNSGTVGTTGEGGAFYGNIYGGGFGTEDTSEMTEAQAVQEAGIIKGNTNITVNGGTVLHNIYGGGANGSVGTFTYDGNNVITGRTSGGVANITILGGTIGTDGHENGMIFGSSRGDVGKPGEIQDKLAWVYDTNVTIGKTADATAGPQIKGSVYGSGENGHTYHDAAVAIHSGMVGITDVSIDGGAAYLYRGNVYGGGCGTDKYTGDDSNKHYNLTAGIVGTTTALGTTTVTIDGGHVVRNVYGGGAMGSVTGGTTVNISGKSVIGADGSGGGYVYAASRGYDDMEAGFATVGSTALNISGGTIWQSAFGGGQLGTVKGSVAVNVTGGVVKNDVYGGGALANTNTDNWNGDGSIRYVALTVKANPTDEELAAGVLKTGVTPVAGYFTEAAGVYTRITNPDAKANGSTTYYKKAVTGTWADGKTSASNTTTVSLTGGLIGNAYGGGLGNSTTMANVYGDVTVEVNRGVSDSTKGIVFNQKTEHPVIGGTDYPTPVMGRVFGCNNYNGTPTGEVTVHVYSTRQIKKDTEGEILPGHGSTDRKFPYEIQSVYGGGNQADYLPATGKKSHVIIDGCNETSIEKVYGGCNSAVIPETDVLINGCYDIGYGFGGGNGGRPIKKEDGNWYENEGAIVIGTARIECQGGKIGQVFGGGDSKGSCGNTAPIIPEQGTGTCPLWITRLYGAGNEGDVSHVNIILAACSGNAIEYVHGGSYNAHVHGDINLTITSGILKNVYGGNDSEGGIEGNITVNIEETDGCNPIIIQNLVGGGNEAAYPGTLKSGGVETPINKHGKITVNVKSATRIDNIYGGSFNAEADADTEININMIKGNKAGETVDIPKEFSYIPNITKLSDNPDGKTIHCTIDNAIGTIGNVFGGGKQGIVKGNTQVNINSAAKVYIMKRNGSGQVLDTSGNPITTTSGQNIPAGITIDCTDAHDTKGAHITGNVFGGGENANVTGSEKVANKGNSAVYICANKTGEGTYAPVAEGAEKVTISNGSVYGGGSAGDVLGNTNVTMSGGYVFNGIFGGGYAGSVGTFTRSTEDEDVNVYGHRAHTGCIGKPISCASGTGTCTVVVNGGQIGPITVATKGMNRSAAEGGPVVEGWIWGGSQGLIQDPDEHPDTHFLSYVGSTDVTVGGTALIMESIIGGGEFGRVLGNTLVKIQGGQIGIGEGKIDGNNQPIRYTDDQFVDPLNTTITAGNALKECSHFPYGRTEGGKKVYLPYDPYHDEYPAYIAAHPEFGPASTANPSDGKTWIGCVFGGGSGYMPYKKRDGSGYDWCRSAGLVEGDTEVRISGGHILTNVYGANEITDVKGKSIISMTGGTIGVPRTEAQIADHPLTCYLFGGGKGDERPRFYDFNVVGSVDIDISGGIIYGSVFGGAEDGHVLGNINLRIHEGDNFTIGSTTYTNGPIIGTWGTTYVEGNVFGGGRGFSGETLTAGSTGGNVTMSIEGGTMRGSVYGGGRLASVGIGLNPPEHLYYGQLKDETGGNGDPTYGHVTINISGGTIGNGTTEAGTGHPVSGNVFGGSMGRITMLDGKTRIPLWPKQAVTKLSNVTISGGEIWNSVYGGGEIGIVRNRATVNVSGGTIHGNVFGGGYGSDDQDKTTITAGGYDDIPTVYYTFTPMIWTGCVAGDTYVNISGGKIGKSVYGGGNYASVGLMNYNSSEDGKTYNYIKKHDTTNGFGLSWPYEFQYIKAAPTDGAPGGNAIGGKTTINITGGRIGTTTSTENAGYVFGGSKGQVSFKKADNTTPITNIDEQVEAEAFCANVRETEITINYAETPESDDGSTTPCIVRTVYGGGEDGHVMENAVVNLKQGWIGRTLFGGGKGTSTYNGTKYVYDGSSWTLTDDQDIHSWTAGKVYGNTTVTIEDGKVGWFVYGGGNMASVGKGNYSGGVDDYSKAGYGETLTGNLWTSATDGDNAWQFLNSGIATITIKGGTVGTAEAGFNADGIPYGSVFGGSRGTAALETSDVASLTDLYKHIPEYYTGYVNKTVINVGGTSTSALSANTPIIYGSIYGGAQDGHVRNSTEVKIFKGSVAGLTSDVNGRSGHVFGAGSGIGTYVDKNDGNKQKINSSSGSVTCKTLVELNDGSIAGNIYGGGALSSVGPLKIGDKNEQHAPSDGHKSISKTQVDIKGGSVGGSVYGAGRGPGDAYYVSQFGGGTPIQTYDKTKFATDIWSDVTVSGGTIGKNVYGGGQGGIVKESTTVSLTGGDIAHNAYGGGQGTANIAADVLGNTTVTLNNNNDGSDADGSKKGCSVDKVFGCNDLNGTPKGHVLVHVYGTQNSGTENMSTKVGPGSRTSLDQGKSEGYIAYLTRLINLAKDGESVKPEITASVITEAQATIDGKSEGSLTDDNKTAISNAAKNVIAELQKLQGYDVTAVYGGGDLAPYVPTVSEETTEVIIEGCNITSIKQVYGGGNAAYVPATNVLVKSAYVIDELFGGGNGLDNYKKDTDGKWYENPGANVGYTELEKYAGGGTGEEGDPYKSTVKTDPDATTKEGRIANYSIGTGVASTTVNGGYIHNVYGGSNKKGNIRREALLQIQQVGTCPLITDKTYAGSKEAPIDAETNTVLDCVREGNEFYGGSQNADILNDVHVRITNGHYTKVFGGNEKAGTITGSITIDIEENGCTPIEIDELYAGGYFAPYSVYGYAAVGEPAEDKDGNPIKDKEGHQLTQRRPLKKGESGALATPSRDPQINIISATKIGKIYGGGYAADLIGSPHINVNMTTGRIREKYASEYPNSTYGYITVEDAAHNKIIPVGVIGTIFGGGNKGDIYGDTFVEIGTGEWLNFTGKRETTDAEGKVYTYNSETKKWDWTKTVGETTTSGTENTKPAPSRNKAFVLRDGTGGQVFGGGDQGYVFGNTNVNIGNGYIYDRVYGGGNEGTVGTVSSRASLPAGHPSHAKCLGGKPTAFATGTGKTTVTVSGGHVGPYSYVRSASTGTATPTPMTMPQDFGYVFAAGRGKMGNPATAGNEDIEFMTYVNETEVTIKNTYEEAFEGDSLAHIVRSPLIAGGVYGGSENGRVLNNTHVNIWGGQIGLGKNKTAAYLETAFIDPTTTMVTDGAEGNALDECAAWPYGKLYGGIKKWLPYDEHADESGYNAATYGEADGTGGSDGHTFYGNVFGGGSGYFAYETTTAGVYEWLPSAGLVEGDTYVNISGGHILTNVYGGNEMTNITGTAHVTMTGGTLGVPRTLETIAAHPVTCYLFGGGKGDQRVHFNKSTNVGHAVVNVSGGIIYGSVFGGGEDGHVLGDVTMNISDGAKIGTWGTSYVDGNVFGGGRGFGGDAYTAGNVAGSVALNITGGTMLGSVYGGGRLGSVGYGLFSKNETGYGEMMADNATETGFVPVGGLTHGRGHVTMNISGGTIGNKYEFIVPAGAGPVSGNDFGSWTAGDWTSWKNTNHVPYTEYDKSNGRLTHTKGGNVFTGGMGRLYQLDGETAISAVDWWKLGNVKSTKLTITGGTIKSNVYGGGELGMVQGTHTSADSKTVGTEIIIEGGTIGTEITSKVGDADVTQYTFGSVYGGGYGSLVEKLTHGTGTNAYETYPKYIAGRVKGSTEVTMTDGTVKASVYGGGEMAAVGESKVLSTSTDPVVKGETLTGAEGKAMDGHTYVTISGGTVGINRTTITDGDNVSYIYYGGATMGNVYGGGSGYINTVRSGHIYGNTNVTISQAEGKTTQIYHNVYGGGAYGTVGDFTYTTTHDTGTGTMKVTDINGLHNDRTGTGTANVTITGGTIGSDGHDNGMVY